MAEENIKELKMSEIDNLKKALAFYADSDNYWSDPLTLDENYCRKTLKAMRAAERENQILQDEGKVARKALLANSIAVLGDLKHD